MGGQDWGYYLGPLCAESGLELLEGDWENWGYWRIRTGKMEVGLGELGGAGKAGLGVFGGL